MAKRSYKVDANGRVTGIPFKYPYTLADWGGDYEALAQDLDLYFDQYESVEKTLGPSDPHPMAFADGEADPRYIADLQAGRISKAVESAVANSLKKMFPSPPPMNPRNLPKEIQVLTRGNEKDLRNLRDVVENRRVAEEARLNARLHPSRAAEYEDRANFYEGLALKGERQYQNSFEAKDAKGDLEFARKEFEKANDLDPQSFKEILPAILPLLEMTRDRKESESTFVIESPELGSHRHHKARIVEMTHPGKSSSEFVRGRSDDELIRAGYGLGLITNWDDGKRKDGEEETIPTKPKEEFYDSLKPYQA